MDHSDDDVVACCYRLLVIYPLHIGSNYSLYSYYLYSYNPYILIVIIIFRNII